MSDYVSFTIPRYPINKSTSFAELKKKCQRAMNDHDIIRRLSNKQRTWLRTGGIHQRKQALRAVYYHQLERARKAGLKTGVVDPDSSLWDALMLDPLAPSFSNADRKTLRNALWEVKRLLGEPIPDRQPAHAA